MLNDYALIIGVRDYQSYANVDGALNDARAMIHECLAMGFSPERIRVLTSPALSAADAGPRAEGIRFGEATRDQIVAGLTWIYGELSGDAPSAGLCTFSGHGSVEQGLVLCPSDFDGSAESAVVVAEVRRAFGDGKAAHNLTVLLDCCHAQGNARSAGKKSVAESLAAIARGLGGGGHVPERLLAACRADQTSVSTRFGGAKMGAFTWAATSTMGQWETTREDGVARLHVSYGELRDRIGALLGALSFEQVPVLSGPPGVAGLPFLYPGRRGGRDETTEDPDAVTPHRQLDIGQYNMSYWNGAAWVVFASINVANNRAGVPIETWTVAMGLTSGLATASDLRLASGAYTFAPGTSMVTSTAAANVSWGSSQAYAYPAGTNSVITFDGRSNYFWMSNNVYESGSLSVTFNIDDRGGFSSVVWYNPTSSNITLYYMANNQVQWLAPPVSSGTYTGYKASSTLS